MSGVDDSGEDSGEMRGRADDAGDDDEDKVDGRPAGDGGDATDPPEDGPVGFSPPPHPDDRLWRHPSEVGAHPIRPIAVPTRRRRSSSWETVVAVAAVSSLLAGVGLATFGFVQRSGDPEPARSELAEQPSGVDSRASLPTYGDVDDGDDMVGHWLTPALVLVDGPAAPGVGVIIDEEGIVLTSAMVFGEASPATLSVRLTDGRTVRGDVLGVDEITGLALLRLAGDGYAAADLIGAAEMAPGRLAYLVSARRAGDVDTVVAAVGDSTLAGERPMAYEGVVAVEAEAGAPVLGGPLVDGGGSVIGIMTAPGDEPGTRRAYVVPAEVAHKVTRDLLETGDVYHSWLGIEAIDIELTDGAAARHGRDGAVGVYGVESGGPAASADLRPDDVIVELDGTAIEQTADLILALRSRSPGDEVRVGLWRDDAYLTLPVVLGAQR